MIKSRYGNVELEDINKSIQLIRSFNLIKKKKNADKIQKEPAPKGVSRRPNQ